ncbi:uncharacterized protein LOC125744416 [Brienomyrus brachyistius]|uniref:uncharacterized protein LOC125744416 n=1 Tax=Brienomyrus brachyistius TaxID=42636 RepID=UPI0020B1A497|nr:uncharacterized protein LOC125744416 [Brienomyrus brachyistius]
MSSMKRQSSWQEDIARNFSRLFLRSKSQSEEKCSSLSSSNVPEDDREEGQNLESALDLPKPIRGSGGESEDSVPADAEAPPSQPASGLPAPRPPAPATPTASLDAFFRKLGSLFQSPGKTEERPADAGQQRQEWEAPEPEPSPAGMTWAVKRSPEQRDPDGGARREPGARHTCQEVEERTEPPREERRQPDLQERRCLPPNAVAGEDDHITPEHSVTTDRPPGGAVDEHRRLALSCPPVVTYGTYRGLRALEKMRRSHQTWAAEEEQKCDAESAHPSPPREETDKFSTPAGSVSLCQRPASQASEGDVSSVGVFPTILSIPVLALLKDSSSQSALSCGPELSLAAAGDQATEPLAGTGKGHMDQLLSSQDSTEKMQKSPTELVEGKAWAAPVVINKDIESGVRQAESSPTACLLGAPSTGDDSMLFESGSAWVHVDALKLGTQSTVVASPLQDSQLSQCCISLSSPGEPEGQEGPVPTEGASDVQQSVLASTQNDSGESDGESIAGSFACLEDIGQAEAFHSESKLLVACVLKNALTALEKIETSEHENQELLMASTALSPVFTAEMEEGMDGCFQPTCLHGGSCVGQGVHSLFRVPVEPITSSRSLMDGSRSTQSSGYQSIVGSDTDIRISSGILCESCSSVSSLDSRQQEQFPVENQILMLPLEIRDSSASKSGCNKGEIATLSSIKVRPTVLMEEDPDNDENSSDMLNQNSRSVAVSKAFLENQRLDSDNGDIVLQVNNVSEQPENFSGIIDKDNVQVDRASGDNDFNKVLSTVSGEVLINEELQVSKESTESNRQFHNTCRLSAPLGSVNFKIKSGTSMTVVEKDYIFEGLENKMETKVFDRGRERIDDLQLHRAFKPIMEVATEIAIMSTKSESLQRSEEQFDRRGLLNVEKSRDSLGSSMDVFHSPRFMQDCLTAARGLKGQQEQRDPQSRVDEGLIQPEGQLAAVNKEEAVSRSEEKVCQVTELGEENAIEEREKLPEQESHALQLASSPSNEGGRQWSAVKAYNCGLPVEHQQDSEILGQGAGVSFYNNVSSRTPGFNVLSKKVPPDLIHGGSRSEISGRPLYRLHEMDFSEGESGFPIINEEEEMDAVFVNDTGVTLSPTSRRGKVYPFSLSPIYEEESIREEVCVDDLREPSVIEEEEQRSMEQKTSSILSLLQSVSERLQSSAFCDQENFETPYTLPRHPSWDCYGDEEDAQPEGEAPGFSMPLPCGSGEELQDRHLENEQPGSLSPTEPFAGTTQTKQASPPQEGIETAQFKDISSTPFYNYIRCARSTAPQRKAEDREPRAFLCHDNGASSFSARKNVINEESQKAIPRPMQIHIYSEVSFSGEGRVFHTDMESMAGMVFLHGASVRVARGCWLLYRLPGYRGSCVALEEGEAVLTHTGGLGSPDYGPTAIAIGSIRRAVKDDNAPEISVQQEGRVLQRLHSESCDLGGNRDVVHLASLAVQSGCWLAYDGVDFTGSYAVLEAGRPPTPGPHGRLVDCVRSLRPLKMGGLTVRKPMDPKMVVYEEPCFQGQRAELDTSVPSLESLPGLQGAASLRVIGGVWVGYSEEGYRGRQFLLEEGEHSSFQDLGLPRHALCSFHVLQGDFIEPSVSLRKGFDVPSAMETNIVDSDVPDLQPVGPARGTSSICVISGLWVAYSRRFFCGEQHVLEKGTYTGSLNWGGVSGPALSIRPIRQELWSSGEPPFLIRAYSQPRCRGESREYKHEEVTLTPQAAMSFRVIRGSWILFDEEGCSGSQFVLGEGLYPDLISCGSVTTSIRSLKPIPYSFSDPSISLYSLDSFEGLEMVVVTSVERLDGFFTQSVRVNSGTWVVYEYAGFKGRQMLLRPGDIPSWGRDSGWDTVGSLHVLRQPKMYVRLRNRALSSVLTAEGTFGGPAPGTASLSPACGLDTQLWVFTGGMLKSKVGKMCLSVVGGRASPGARVALWPQVGRQHQKWSLNENGTISSHLDHNLVLDIKGGSELDRDHLVTTDFTADRETQYWDIEVV